MISVWARVVGQAASLRRLGDPVESLTRYLSPFDWNFRDKQRKQIVISHVMSRSVRRSWLKALNCAPLGLSLMLIDFHH